MFKMLIKKVIEALDIVLSELKRAYSETYELSDLTKEFIEKVKEIKEENKQTFLKIAERLELQKSAFEFEFAPPYIIKKRAKERWKEALKNGDLDELYNIKRKDLK